MKYSRLGDVTKFIRGITFKPTDVMEGENESSIVCLRTKNVQSELDCRDLIRVPRTFVKNEAQFLKCGDLLVSSANSWNLVGKCSWIPELDFDATLGGFVSALRPKKEYVFDRYLYYWFSWNKTQELVRSCARQTTNIANLSIKQCEDLMLPLPPLEEQKRIAAILDKADELRRLRQESIKKLNTLSQSIFYEMFGGDNDGCLVPIVNLGDVCNKITDGTHQAPKWADCGIPFIFVSNVRNNEISLETNKWVSEKTYLELTKTSPIEYGDVLYTAVGSYGYAAVVDFNDKFLFQRHIAQIKPIKSKLNSFYLAHCLEIPFVRRQVDKIAMGVAQKTVTLSELKKIQIPCPTLSSQEKYFEKIKVLIDAQRQMKNELISLDSLFQSLQQRAFNGEL